MPLGAPVVVRDCGSIGRARYQHSTKLQGKFHINLSYHPYPPEPQNLHFNYSLGKYLFGIIKIPKGTKNVNCNQKV